jgi:hypothetical protein
MNISSRKLQHTYSNHAPDFGITGPWNAANGSILEQAIRDHIANPATVQIVGTYRATIAVVHYFNASTGLWVAVDTGDEFVAGWRLSAAQRGHLMASANVQ